MERRKFIATGCIYCFGVAALGLAITELASCASIPMYKTSEQKDMQVPLNLFAQSKVVIVRPAESEFDILLVKKSDSEYVALLMECTHRDNPLTATSSGLFCPAHGSRFDLNGSVTEGPATESLKQYKTVVNQTTVTINLI